MNAARSTKKSAKRVGAASKTAERPPHNACYAFVKLVEHYGYETSYHSPEDTKYWGPSGPLTNLTFWAGAGFSKAWEPSAPLGNELFTLKEGLPELTSAGRFYDVFEEVLDGGAITPGHVREIVYRLDMYTKYPDLRSRYLDDQNLRMLKAALRNAVWKNFDAISKLNYIDVDTGRFRATSLSPAQRHIVQFFRYLNWRSLDTGVSVEGLFAHFVTTNYDFVIETILDNCQDRGALPLFEFTYRGFTPRTIGPVPHQIKIHEKGVQHLLKLNGGFEILPASTDGYSLHYGPRSDDEIVQMPPVLMLPSREQDYMDPYFRAIFPKAVRLMRESTILVIVGYSLPEEDALIRFILR